MKNLPRNKFTLGEMLNFANDPLKYIGRGFDTCGDSYSMRVFRNFLVTRDPDIFKHVLVTNNKNYHKGDASKTLSLALGNGLLTSEGDFWLRQRRLAQPAFHKEKIVALSKTMEDITRKFLLDFEKQRGKIVDIDEQMMGITADIALKTLFSTITFEDKVKIYHLINETQEYLIKRLRRPYLIPFMGMNGDNAKFKLNKNYFDSFIYELINKRRAEKENYSDLLQMFLDSVDADTGETMNDLQVRDEAMTMFAAGHETSANGLNWILYEISQNQEIIDKLREEAKLFDDVPNFEQLMAMPYSRIVVAEALRLFPPAWATIREAYQADDINGIKIKKGDVIFLSIYNLHRNPNYWQNSQVFNPDNFNDSNKIKQNKYQYLPFGAGPRLCIGQQFALMEMQMILTSLIKKFDFERIVTLPPKMFPLITLKPINGLKMKVF